MPRRLEPKRKRYDNDEDFFPAELTERLRVAKGVRGQITINRPGDKMSSGEQALPKELVDELRGALDWTRYGGSVSVYVKGSSTTPRRRRASRRPAAEQLLARGHGAVTVAVVVGLPEHEVRQLQRELGKPARGRIVDVQATDSQIVTGIKHLMFYHGVTREEFAPRLEMSPSLLKSLLNGEKRFTAEELQSCLEQLATRLRMRVALLRKQAALVGVALSDLGAGVEVEVVHEPDESSGQKT